MIAFFVGLALNSKKRHCLLVIHFSHWSALSTTPFPFISVLNVPVSEPPGRKTSVMNRENLHLATLQNKLLNKANRK